MSRCQSGCFRVRRASAMGSRVAAGGPGGHEQQRRLAARHVVAHAEAAGHGIGVADAAARDHVGGVADAAAGMRGGRRRDAERLGQGDHGNAGGILADARIVVDDGARMRLEREVSGIARAVRASDDHRAFGVRAELGRGVRQHDLFRQGGLGHGAKDGPSRHVWQSSAVAAGCRRSLTGRRTPPIIGAKIGTGDGEDTTLAGKGAAPRETAAPPRNLDAARLLGLYRDMLRIRAFEEAALRGLEQKLVLGAIHPSIGQEAVAVGVCRNLEPSDILLSTHRGHGHTIAKGADTLAMMRELFGREGGTCHGKGGSMHIADFKVGMLGANGVVGANILIAVGAAHAVRLKKGARS